MCSGKDDTALPVPGFPIRTSPDLRLFGDYPELFAACHVLLRLLPPRHPPYALSILIREDLYTTLCSFQGASGSRHIYLFRTACPRADPLETKFKVLVPVAPFLHATLNFLIFLVALFVPLEEPANQDSNRCYKPYPGSVPRNLADPYKGYGPDTRPRQHHQQR